VGKIGLPDELLPSRSHMSGDELACCASTPSPARRPDGPGKPAQAGTFIRGHHERWDGQGYPDRLSGWRFPMARGSWRWPTISTPADRHLSPRKLKPDEAVAFIQQNRGNATARRWWTLRRGAGRRRHRRGIGNEHSPSSLGPAWCWPAIW
jgi:hypothetical protein